MNYLTEPLDKKHRQHSIDGFDCGTPVLNTWLTTQAGQAARKGLSVTYVITDDHNVVRGYYALAVRRLLPTGSLPEGFVAQFPDGTSGALLARLAVDKSVQGRGIGGALLIEAMQRVKQAAAENGNLLLFVDAKDGQVSFYAKYGFTPLATDPQMLFIRIDEIP